MGGKMKLLKKICYVIAFIFFIVAEITFPVEDINVEADGKTLRKMKNELAALEQKLNENKAAQQSAQTNITSSKARIEEITQEKVDVAAKYNRDHTNKEFMDHYGFGYPALKARIKKRDAKAEPRIDIPKLNRRVRKSDSSSKKPKVYPEFRVRKEKVDKVSRSVQIDKDIYERLKRLEAQESNSYRSAVLNKVLDEGLKKYGF